MLKAIGIATFVSGAVPLAACVQRGEAKPSILVYVDGGDCRMAIEGEVVSSEQLFEIGRSNPTRRGIVIFSGDTPYKCIGGAVSALQRGGLASVEAVSSIGS